MERGEPRPFGTEGLGPISSRCSRRSYRGPLCLSSISRYPRSLRKEDSTSLLVDSLCDWGWVGSPSKGRSRLPACVFVCGGSVPDESSTTPVDCKTKP